MARLDRKSSRVRMPRPKVKRRTPPLKTIKRLIILDILINIYHISGGDLGQYAVVIKMLIQMLGLT